MHFIFNLLVLLCGFVQAEESLPLVVITQIVEHDALNKEKEGVLKALEEAGYVDGKNIRIIQNDAQGSLVTATQIAQQFATQNPTVAVGISTPSAQPLVAALKDRDVPVVFTAVTDPISAKLVSKLEGQPENVTGVSDALPLKVQLELIKKLIPNLKKVGVVTNPGEANSAKSVEDLKAIAPELGIELVFATATKTAEAVGAVQSLLGRVQAVFIPNDSTTMSAISAIAAFGRANMLPIFTADYESVARGVLAAKAYDRRVLGKKAGEQVVAILKGAKANSLPVATDHPVALRINTKSAAEIGARIPKKIFEEAEIVDTDELS